MTPRERYSILISVILGVVAVEATVGIVWLAVTGHETPAALTSLASASIGALAGALSVAPTLHRGNNGTSSRPPTDPAA